MSEVPALPPPSGVVSNFSDPTTQKVQLIVLNTVGFGLMVFFFALQTYARVFVFPERRIRLDDGRC